MADVYQNSVCIIAALAAKNSHDGCFVRRKPISSWPCRIRGDDKRGVYVYRRDHDHEGYNELPPTLYTRAWVLQEQLLSPRVINYRAHMISWECRQQKASEERPQGEELDWEGWIGPRHSYSYSKRSFYKLAPSPKQEGTLNLADLQE